MDQMLDHLIRCTRLTPSGCEKERRQLADYLAGKIDFNEILPLLPASPSNRIANQPDKINAACLADRGMLPRLGRYLRALHRIDHTTYRLCALSHAHALTPRRVFLDGGLGPQALLAFLFRDGGGDCDLAEALDELEAAYPGEIERYVRNGEPETALQPLAYLCGRDGADLERTDGPLDLRRATLGQMLGRWAPQVFLQWTRQWGTRLQETFRQKVIQAVPEGEALLAAGGESDRGREDGTSAQVAVSALVLARYRLPGLNQLAKAACETSHPHFLNAFVYALPREAGAFRVNLLNRVYRYQDKEPGAVRQSVREQLTRMAEALERQGIPPAYVCAWAASFLPYAPELWGQAFQELYGQGDTASQAFHKSTLLGRLTLYRFLAARGEAPEGDVRGDWARTFRSVAGRHASQDDARTVAEWVAEGRGEPAKLPPLDGYYRHMEQFFQPAMPAYDVHYAIWMLTGLDPAADRYFAYLIQGKRYEVVSAGVQFLLAYLGLPPDQVIEHVGGERESASAFCLVMGAQLFDTEATEPYLQVVRKLVERDLEGVWDAARDAETPAAVKLTLLEMLRPFFRADSGSRLLELLEDRSKKVRQFAMDSLCAQKELEGEVRLLLGARKKGVREAAAQLLVAYREN